MPKGLDRRTFLRSSTTLLAAGSLPTILLGCGGGDESAAPPAPIPPTTSNPPFTLGYTPPSAQELAVRLPTIVGATQGGNALPSAVDLTQQVWSPPVYNQQSTNACASFAVAAATTALIARANNVSARDARNFLSQLDLYTKVLALQNSACNSGSAIANNCNVLIVQGVGSLSEVPWRDQVCLGPNDLKTFRLGSFHNIAPTDQRTIKQALAEGIMLIFGMALYADFFGIKSAPYVRQSNAWVGNHAMVVSGYDDATKSYLVQNSWDPNQWGNSGLGKISYATFETDVFEVVVPILAGAQPTPTPTPTPKPTILTVSGLSSFNWQQSRGVLEVSLEITRPLFLTRIQIGPVSFPGLVYGTPNQWITRTTIATMQNAGWFYAAGTYIIHVWGLDERGAQIEIVQYFEVQFSGPMPG